MTYRVHLSGWTASFRYPVFISGFQPTLPVPPLSTVYGIISAAVGSIIKPSQLPVGYVFLSTTVGVDLETIYELAAPLKAKTNVIKRQFLFEPNLYLYFDNDKIVEAFSRPHYPMLLGRSTELAMVEEITTIEVIPKERQKLGGTVVPFPTVGVHGPLQALPTYMTDDIPRKAMGTKPFHILKDFIIYEAELPTDAEKQWAVWMHGE